MEVVIAVQIAILIFGPNGGVQYSCFVPYGGVQIVFTQNEGANLKDLQ